MNKNDLIRCRAGLASMIVAGSMFLGGCASSRGFEFSRDVDNSYSAVYNSYINNECIEKCYVVEAYNKLTEETELFIAKKMNRPINEVGIVNGERYFRKMYYYYTDLMNNNNELFYQDNSKNNFFEFVKETPLYDYMISLDLIKAKYSYEDMERILSEIEAVYEFESDKELVK